MGRTVRTVTTEEKQLPEDEVSTEQESDDEIGDEQQLAISELLGMDGASTIRWKVDKTSPIPEAGFCANYYGTELSLERLKEEFGAGAYQITGYDAGGKYIKGGRRKLTIAKSHVPIQSNNVLSQKDLLELVMKKPEGNGELIQMMQLMMQQSTQQMQQQMQLASQQTQMMTGLLTAMLGKPADKGPDALAMIAALKDVLAPADKTSANDSVSMLLKGIELGKDLGGDGGPSDWTALVGKGFDMAKPLLEAAAAQNPSSGNAAPVGALPGSPPPERSAPTVFPSQNSALQSPTPQSEGDPVLLKFQWLSRQVQSLLMQAERRKDPELYATVFVDNLPSFLSEEEVYLHFTDPNALQNLAQINPRVMVFREWFEAFRIGVIHALDANDAEQHPPAPTPQATPAPIFIPMGTNGTPVFAPNPPAPSSAMDENPFTDDGM